MEIGHNADNTDPPQADLATRLRAGEHVCDSEFDQIFAAATRSVSFRHWTPMSVATRAARLLTEAGAKEILDVGSGPGKVCIVGALTTAARFTGVEQRVRLVEEARAAAVALGADRARFVHGNFLELDCASFDGFYFYNPFQEHIDSDDIWPIDTALERSPVLHRTYVACVAAALIRAPVGTLVATFHGFGAPMPRHYRLLHTEDMCGGELTLWIRVDQLRNRAHGAEATQAGAARTGDHESPSAQSATLRVGDGREG